MNILQEAAGYGISAINTIINQGCPLRPPVLSRRTKLPSDVESIEGS
jgi:hypothetical protein